MKIDGINVRGNFTWIAFQRLLELFSFMIDFSSSAYFWKHLGGDGEKMSYLSKLFPGRIWWFGTSIPWAGFYKLSQGPRVIQGNGWKSRLRSLCEWIQIITNIYWVSVIFQTCYKWWVAFWVIQLVKNLFTMQKTQVRSWVGKSPWRRKWWPTPALLPGEIPWTEEPGGLQSMGLQRVGHDLATKALTIYKCWGPSSEGGNSDGILLTIMHGNSHLMNQKVGGFEPEASVLS